MLAPVVCVWFGILGYGIYNMDEHSQTEVKAPARGCLLWTEAGQVHVIKPPHFRLKYHRTPAPDPTFQTW